MLSTWNTASTQGTAIESPKESALYLLQAYLYGSRGRKTAVVLSAASSPDTCFTEHTVRSSTSGTWCLNIKGSPPARYDLLTILEQTISCSPDGPNCISTESILWLPHLQRLFPCP